MKEDKLSKESFGVFSVGAAESTSMVPIPRGVIDSIFALLKPYCPDLAVLREQDVRPSSSDGQKSWLTRKEAAELLSVSLNTLNRYMKTGKIRKVVLSDHAVRIERKSLEEFLAN